MSGSRQCFAAVLAAVFFVIFRVAAGAASDGPEFSGEIVIGATFPLTGDKNYYGQSAYYGAVTKAKMINDAGGINGKRLVLRWLDNGSSSEKAIRDVNDLIDKENVKAFLGPLLSDSSIAMQKTANEKKVVFISPFATSDAVTKGQEWFFRASFNNTVQSQAMTEFQMENFGAKSCAILFDPRYKFSNELANVFERTFRAAGGKIVGTLSIVSYTGKTDYAGPLKKLAAYKPDFIYVPCYAAEAVELIHAARDLGIDTRFAGPSMWDNELLFIASGRRLAGTAFTSCLFEQTYRYAPFQEFYKAMRQAGMDYPDAMAASAYDALALLAEGFKNGESAEEIRDGLLNVKYLPLATGVTSVQPDHNVSKPVFVRYVELQRSRLVPIYADRYDLEE